MKRVFAWRIAFWILSGIFIATAALNLLEIDGGFWTSYAADLFLPPWLYIIVRRLAAGSSGRSGWLHAWLGRSPTRAALAIFSGSAITEISQIFWPRGIFRGTFDPLDLVAFGAGLLACYLIDRKQVRAMSAAPMGAGATSS